MKQEIVALAEHRLKRARETFAEAITLLGSDSLNGALNRFYYAAFYAARALLATKEVDSSKHSGVISLFHSHFVKPGIFDREKAKALSRSFEERQDSDYEDFVSLTSDDIAEIHQQVKVFVEECEMILKDLSN